MITLDQELVGKLARDVVQAADKVNPDKIGYKEVPYSQKTRLDRLKADGKAIVEDDDSDEGEDEDDTDGAARLRRKEAKIEKSDAKKRARGRNSTLKKMLRKRKRNVVDPQTVSRLILEHARALLTRGIINLARSPSRRRWPSSARQPRQPSRMLL